jgi:hypothetical protein
MPTHRLTPEIIRAAILGFEQQRLRLDTQIAEFRAMLDGGRPQPVSAPEVPKGKRRKMSAAARKRIGDAQRKRWAASKGESESASISTKPKRKLSAAGKAAIVAALKKRWAAKRAAAKKAPAKTAAKKAVKAPGATGTTAAR